jgi:hypothetical protein
MRLSQSGGDYHDLRHHRYDSAVAAIKKAVELMGDGTRDVHITDPSFN